MPLTFGPLLRALCVALMLSAVHALHGGLVNVTDLAAARVLQAGTGLCNPAWKTLSAGIEHVCAIQLGTATIYCWGYDGAGRLDVPELQADQVAVSAGGDRSCSLSTNGTLSCWGGGSDQYPESIRWGQHIAVSASEMFTCVVSPMFGDGSGGMVSCFGANGAGQASVPAAASSGQINVATGTRHACSLSVGGAVVCWLTDNWGYSPYQRSFPATAPAAVSSQQVSLSAKGDHVCSLSSVGTVMLGQWCDLYCYGTTSRHD